MTLSPVSSPRPSPPWFFRSSKWVKWNELISTNLHSVSFRNIKNPDSSYSVFYDAIMLASKQFFSPSSTPFVLKKRPKPWWNASCRKAVALARQAFTTWKKCPSPLNKQNLNRLNAVMKRTISKEKNRSWSEYVENLDPRKGTSKLWNFTRSMFGFNKGSLNDWESIPSIDDYETPID